MRTLSPALARGLAYSGVAAALFIVSSAAAAPTRHAKPAHVASATSTPATDAAADEAPTSTESAATAPSDAPPDAVVDTPPTPAPAPQANAPVTPTSDVGAPSDAALGKREAERIAVGRIEVAVFGSLDIASRHFKYSDPVGHLLAPYSLPAVPMATIGLEAYPLASTGLPVLQDLGLRGRLSHAVGADSTTPDGIAINTSWTRFSGELRERLLIPGTHPTEFGVFVGGDANYFDMSAKSKVAAYPPRARTIAVRVGLDARVLLAGSFSTVLGVSYLAVTEAGEIYDRFRDPSVHGVDADLGFALKLLPGLEARLCGRYTRYFSTFKPQLGDAAVAGGTLDQLLQVGLGARYAH
jgi:hypothetical protein